MISHLGLVSKFLHSKLLATSILVLSLSITSTCLAQYNPPPNQPPSRGNTTSSGTRGRCASSNSQGALTLLAPIKHIGQTAFTHPTFAWFVPEGKPLPIEFQLFELDETNKVKQIQRVEMQSVPGIMKISLPENQPGLTVGKRYLWQVVLVCDGNRPSNSVVAIAEIQVVQMPPALKGELSNVKDLSQIVELYAKAGLWYDALQEALRSAQGSSLGQTATNLLEQLATIEDAQQSARLKEIANIQR